jgi:hypothetical protein
VSIAYKLNHPKEQKINQLTFCINQILGDERARCCDFQVCKAQKLWRVAANKFKTISSDKDAPTSYFYCVSIESSPTTVDLHSIRHFDDLCWCS